MKSKVKGGLLTYDGDEWGKYDFALSFDERHGENDAEHLKEVFADSVVVRLTDDVVLYSRERRQKAEDGEKLMNEKRMKDFHRIVMDMDYRKELREEVE